MAPGEGDSSEPLAKRFITYLNSCPHVSKSLNVFMEENCHRFAVGPEEQKLEHMDLYQQYVELVEKRMAEFITHCGMTEEQFAEEIKVSLESSTAEGNADWDTWMKRTDYASFAETMIQKHRSMKSAGGDEQVCFDDDEDEES